MIANRRKREKKSSVFLLFFFLFFNFFFVFVLCAFFFSRLLVEFCLAASGETPKWRKKKSVLREFLYMRLLYSITSFWMCDDDYDGYDVCKVPSSYRQPSGRGQLLSRRYCKHSG